MAHLVETNPLLGSLEPLGARPRFWRLNRETPLLETPDKPGDPAQWWLGWRGVALVTLLIQTAMATWAYRHNLMYSFGDSLSHMTIARRLWDSPNPGLSQLGTTWLPVPHLFFSLGSVWMWAWRTGVGGAFFTIVCSVATAVSLHRIAERTGVGNAGGWIAAMVMALNPSWSYLSAVPMTEPFSVAFSCLTVAGLLGWSSSKRPYSAGMTALFCGLPAAADVLSRFEGWGFVAVATFFVAIVCYQRFGWTVEMRNQLLAFVLPPAIAIFWWFVFNWTVFGSPLEFATGKYASRSLIAPFAALGLVYGKGSVPAALALYGRDALDIGGSLIIIAAFIGLGVTFLKWKGLRQELWLSLIGLSLFIVVAIDLGQIYIRLPEMIPYGIENSRYGTELLPFLAVAAAQILRLIPTRLPGDRRRALARWSAALIIVACSGGWMVGLANGSMPANALTVLEAKANTAAGISQRQLASWLHTNATTGYILLDETVFPIVPLIGLDLHRVIVTSAGHVYQHLLAHPNLITWVAVKPGDKNDEVWHTLQRDKVFGTLFFPVAAFRGFIVYKQIPPDQQPPPNSLLSGTLRTTP
ncbi:MAG: hypothetical protein HIU84_04430 [Acidobacteria bacterium]|nr:hypothetical protein [Acidobacteriota bacterium]